MSRLFLLPFLLSACSDPVPSWFLEEPCPDGQYTLSNLSAETQTCVDLPDSCPLADFNGAGPTEACMDALCPDDLQTGVIVSSDDGEVSVDCEAPAA